ncbi:MAG TPA: dTMP kinase, partial [archaeon]|nr:dTMP kinase [archaeon]
PAKPSFIVIEGLDGAGCSTQSTLLYEWLNLKGRRAVLTHEPTSDVIGGLIRSALKNEWHATPECLQLLFAADRSHHLSAEIDPALSKGFSVVCDRYLYSALAYGAVELDYKWISAVNSSFKEPDVTVFIDVSPEECLRRTKESRPSFELFERLEVLKKVALNYKKLAREHSNFHIVNGEQSIERVHEAVREIVVKKLKIA